MSRYEMHDFLNRKAKMSTAILKNPAGSYSFVGSVPLALCHPTKHSYVPGAMSSNCYPTEKDAIAALLSVGIENFQLNDCSWYRHNQEATQ